MAFVTSLTQLTDPRSAKPLGPPALEVEGLSIELTSHHGSGRIVDNVRFTVRAGEAFGLVGESGSGKSMTALAVMRLLPSVARVISGTVVVNGKNVLQLGRKEMESVRGGTVGLVFQQARSSLNPLLRVGDQISRVMVTHHRVGSRKEVSERIESVLADVGLPAHVARSYPHQLSGGMAQRALIATVLSAEPAILIADEPTTGLDVTTEAEIYELLARLRLEKNLALFLITHDLAIVGQYCDTASVMHAGHIVETASVSALFAKPLHPYTRALLGSIPDPGSADPPREILVGEAPRVADLAVRGCRFIARCPFARPDCSDPLFVREVDPGHLVLCRLYD